MARRWIHKRRIALLLAAAALLAGCVQPAPAPPETESAGSPALRELNRQNVLATVWMQRAAERDALYLQAFNLARDRLDALLASRNSAIPPAVVADIDESVLDNSPYMAWKIRNESEFPAHWSDWARLVQANPMPGAVDFLRHAVSRGVDVYYISNRKDALLEPTLKNLKKWGFPQADAEHVLLRTTKSGDKTQRRDQVTRDHEILLLIGDNLGDFDQLFQGRPPAERQSLVERHAAQFGRRYIMLPNPMYGEWENALYRYQRTLPADRKVKARLDALRPMQAPAD